MVEVSRGEFVPAEASDLVDLDGTGEGTFFPEADAGAGGILDESEAAVGHDLHGGHDDVSSEVFGFGYGGVEIFDVDVAVPHGGYALLLHFGAELAAAGDGHAVFGEHGVWAGVGCGLHFAVPSEDLVVELSGGFEVGGGEVDPAEFPDVVGLAHGHGGISDVGRLCVCCPMTVRTLGEQFLCGMMIGVVGCGIQHKSGEVGN